jgi:hypothetical protein
VIDLGEESGFALEAVQAFLVSRKLLGKHFDSDVSSELGIAGSIDFSHTARADRFDDFVLAEFGSWGEGHG